MFEALEVTPRADGSVVIAAPKEVAADLAALFQGMARLVAGASTDGSRAA